MPRVRTLGEVEVPVDVVGEYPQGEWITPFQLPVYPSQVGQVFGFWFPSFVYYNDVRNGIDHVENGYVERVEERLGVTRSLVKTVAEAADKTLKVVYSPTAAEYQWSHGGAALYVWDVWKRPIRAMVFVEVNEASPHGGGYWWHVRVRYEWGDRKPKVIMRETTGHGIVVEWSDDVAEYEGYFDSPDRVRFLFDDYLAGEAPVGEMGEKDLRTQENLLLGVDLTFFPSGDYVECWVIESWDSGGQWVWKGGGHIRYEWIRKYSFWEHIKFDVKTRWGTLFEVISVPRDAVRQAE